MEVSLNTDMLFRFSVGLDVTEKGTAAGRNAA
jgi:hypothetical protein